MSFWLTIYFIFSFALLGFIIFKIIVELKKLKKDEKEKIEVRKFFKRPRPEKKHSKKQREKYLKKKCLKIK